MEKYNAQPKMTETEAETAYLGALEKWSKRVQMWIRTNEGRPPVFLDDSGNAHWANRATRRKGGKR